MLPHAVGEKAPNEVGLYDMAGNVWEWVEDCWNGSYKGAPADGSAWTSGDCSRRVLRGGSWVNSPEPLRSALRFRNDTGGPVRPQFGFRVARRSAAGAGGLKGLSGARTSVQGRP